MQSFPWNLFLLFHPLRCSEATAACTSIRHWSHQCAAGFADIQNERHVEVRWLLMRFERIPMRSNSVDQCKEQASPNRILCGAVRVNLKIYNEDTTELEILETWNAYLGKLQEASTVSARMVMKAGANKATEVDFPKAFGPNNMPHVSEILDTKL